MTLLHLLQSEAAKLLDAVPAEVFVIQNADREFILLDVECAWAALQLTFGDEIEDEILNSDRDEWSAVGSALEAAGFARNRSPGIAAANDLIEFEFRRRVSERNPAYSPTSHAQCFAHRAALGSRAVETAPSEQAVSRMADCLLQLTVLARQGTPGLSCHRFNLDRAPTEDEWEAIYQHDVWEGVVEHCLPIYDEDIGSEWVAWAKALGHGNGIRDPLQEWIKSYFEGEIEHWMAIAQRYGHST